MYDSFFGLRKRPFAATPDPEHLVPLAGSWSALEQLRRCAADGNGIGVLTAPAGMGKTLVCRCLARDLSGEFAVVMLPSGNFLTRRSLLQAILYDLGHSYVRLDEQELRLAFGAAVRQLRPAFQGLLLIADEAHLLPARLLEELRTLTNHCDDGEPLVRLVVSGQLQLEETLSLPELRGFNQRIAGQAALQPLSLQESVEYVERRLALAGANISDVFYSDALATVCEASDGVPRNINQLCDHSLLLSYMATERPITIGTVREALEDLKHLPQSWNEPVNSRGALAWAELQIERSRACARAEEQQALASPIATSPSVIERPVEDEPACVIEFGDSDDDVFVEDEQPAVLEFAAPVVEMPISPPVIAASPLPVAAEKIEEELVVDAYAALDARAARQRHRPQPIKVSARNAVKSMPAAPAPIDSSPVAHDAEPITAEAAAAKAESRAALAAINNFLDAAGFVGASEERGEKPAVRDTSKPVRIDVRTPALLHFQASTEPSSAMTVSTPAAMPQPTLHAVDFDTVMPEADEPEAERPSSVADISRRRYQMLFSELMRPRKQA